MKIENDKLIVIREYKGLYSSENLLKKIIQFELESYRDCKLSLDKIPNVEICSRNTYFIPKNEPLTVYLFKHLQNYYNLLLNCYI